MRRASSLIFSRKDTKTTKVMNTSLMSPKPFLVVFLMAFLTFLLLPKTFLAQSVLKVPESSVTQDLALDPEMLENSQAFVLNMDAAGESPDMDLEEYYQSPKFDLLFRLNYNKDLIDSWNFDWKVEVKFRLLRVCEKKENENFVDLGSDGDRVCTPDFFNNLGDDPTAPGVMTLSLHQENLQNTEELSQVFVDYLMVHKKETLQDGSLMETVFDRQDLINKSDSEPYVTAIEITGISITDGAGNEIAPELYNGGIIGESSDHDPVFTLSVIPKAHKVYGRVADFLEDETLDICEGPFCYNADQEEWLWSKIDNAHYYDLEWVFIDRYDSEHINTASEAFARRRGVRVRTADRYYLTRLGTEITYPQGRVFFRLRGVGKSLLTRNEGTENERQEEVFTTGGWTYAEQFLHLGEAYEDEANQPIIEPLGVYLSAHESERNWQYATVFAEEGKYKKVMSYFDPSLRGTQTLTNFSTNTDRNNDKSKDEVTLVEEQFYDYEGRAVVQTIPAPLSTASLAHQSVNNDRVNYFANGKKAYDNLQQAESPALATGSLTASYYSQNPDEKVNFSTSARFKHDDYVPIANGYPYTQVRYTNDGTGRVAAQSGVGREFRMGGGKEVRTYYLNPAEDELRSLFGDEVGEISRYKKVVTVDPNGQASVAYMDQAGQTIATGLMGESPEQLRQLEDNKAVTTTLHLIKGNQKSKKLSKTEYTFYNPVQRQYTLEYAMKGGKTEFNLNSEDFCLACEYELEITLLDAQGELVQDASNQIPYRTTMSGAGLLADCENDPLNDFAGVSLSFDLAAGEYTIVKNLYLTAGYQNLNEEEYNNPNTAGFRARSEEAIADKAKGDCIDCTEMVEEDGTITWSEGEDDCQDESKTRYTASEMHTLFVSEQIAEQCQSHQDQYTSQPCQHEYSEELLEDDEPACEPIDLDPAQGADALIAAYQAVPLCILCTDETTSNQLADLGIEPSTDVIAVKQGLQNSAFYDSYMRRVTRFDAANEALFIDRTGHQDDETNFRNPIASDPFWELWESQYGNIAASVPSRTAIAAQWSSIAQEGQQNANDYIAEYNADPETADDLTIAQQEEVKWLIFSGLYESFKREYQKVFYSKLSLFNDGTGGFAPCNARAIEILFPELGGNEATIGLADLNSDNIAYTNPDFFSDYEEEYERVWLGYTGIAFCGDWADNIIATLGIREGEYCQNQSWELEEMQKAVMKAALEEYCGAIKDEPLNNAFKKLYYSPFVTYPLLTQFRNSVTLPNPAAYDIADYLSAQDYVNAFNTFLSTLPAPIATDLRIAFEVKLGGSSTDPAALFGRDDWNADFPEKTDVERLVAHIESAIRAVDPNVSYAVDLDGDGTTETDTYSQTVNEALTAAKNAFLNGSTDECKKRAFYSLLSLPDCRTFQTQEVEVPASAEDLPVETEGLELKPRRLEAGDVLGIFGGRYSVETIKTPDSGINLYNPEERDEQGYMIEATIEPNLPDLSTPETTPADGDKFILFASTNIDRTFNRRSGFEVGFVYDEDQEGYRLYQEIHINVFRYNPACNNVSSDIETREAKSGILSESQLRGCHHILLTESPKANLEDKTQQLYYDGSPIALEKEYSRFPLSKTPNCERIIGKGRISYHEPTVFPLHIGGEVNTAFQGKIQEVRVWKRTESFGVADIAPYVKKTLPAAYQARPELLGHWKLDDYTITGTGNNTKLRFQDYSIHGKDIAQEASYQSGVGVVIFPRDVLYVAATNTTCITHDRPMVSKTIRTCKDSYTFGNGNDLWGSRPIEPPTPADFKAACEQVTKDILGDYTERLIAEQRAILEEKVKEKYYDDCFKNPFSETLNLSYERNEYHHTLYYYDQAGNLVQTVPPEGVNYDGTGENHSLQTQYKYNTLGQVVWQKTPDAGVSRFWIDYYGRVKLSQNAEQEKHNEYAYSKFDELGRPYEVGKLHSSLGLRLYEEEGFSEGTLLDQSELIFDSAFPAAGQVELLQVNGGTPSTTFTLSERTLTFYNEEEVTLGGTLVVSTQEQSYLRNRVAAVVVAEEDISEEGQALTDIGAITRYAYDIHGNVETLWQHLPEQTGLPEKRVDYDYDLLSGKVNQVVYQKGEEDEFRHRYTYDGDNRLIEVETSLDGYHWTLEAEYFYYAHGPLARIEVGEHNVQGTDYFYTLQGWIKGVNAIGLQAQNDLGKDGTENSTFNQDEFAYTLNYYQGDYVARGSNVSNNDILGTAFTLNEDYNNFTGFRDNSDQTGYRRESLYNGNIAAMATSIRHFNNDGNWHTQSMNYRYDQLHRIAAADVKVWRGDRWDQGNEAYQTAYTYDKNGNIQSLFRSGHNGQTVDVIDYTYDAEKKNRLLNTVDAFGTDEGLVQNLNYTYQYDNIGNLVSNTGEGIENIEWNIYGKVERVEKEDAFGAPIIIEYKYDGTGNRISKRVSGSTLTTTTYVRDASGNVLAIYKNEEIQETIIYGSSRLGQYRRKADRKETALGQRIYEFSNHLGNVLVILSDHKVPQTDGTYSSVVVSASDYYPFGLAMSERTYQNSEYRYGFNGQEQSDELDPDGNSYTAEFWQYDSRIGRRWNIDPITVAWESPYATFRNNPIALSDPYGDCADCKTHTIQKGETLTSISKKYGTTVKNLAKWNNISDPDVIYAGDNLIVSDPSKEGSFRRMTLGEFTSLTPKERKQALIDAGIDPDYDVLYNSKTQENEAGLVNIVNSPSEQEINSLWAAVVTLDVIFLGQGTVRNPVSNGTRARNLLKIRRAPTPVQRIYRTSTKPQPEASGTRSFEVREGVAYVDGKVAHGSYDFIVTLGGQIRIGSGHWKMSGGADYVQAAGGMRFKNGVLSSINNKSGHYMPSVENTRLFKNVLQKVLGGGYIKGAKLTGYRWIQQNGRSRPKAEFTEVIK